MNRTWAQKYVAADRRSFVLPLNSRSARALWFSGRILASTCQRLNAEPWRYLRDVLERLPSHPPDRLAELLPDEWAKVQRASAP
jgi:hypothetical protein